ncbi:MAG: M48 family metalloprotease [Proteobacteria bacterium]|nr:M48 family metalloprotease [Pseudomonadota bacterium]
MPGVTVSGPLAPSRRDLAASMSRGFSRVFLCACTAAFLWSLPVQSARAQEATLSHPIPAQPVDTALSEFSLQTGIQTAYPSDLLKNQTSQAVPAGLAPTPALRQLLGGTGLWFDYLNPRIVRIRPATAQDGQDPDAAAQLEVVYITADKIPKPPHVAPPTPEEARKMELANEQLEEHIRNAHLLYGNAALDSYVQGVTERLLATDGTDPSRVHARVIRGADANAFSLSNGSIYVTTGLLTTLRDESELAAVLGHETTHYTNAHVLRGMREQQRTETAAHTAGAILGVLLAAVAQHYAGKSPTSVPSSLVSIPNDSMQIWARAIASGYSRDLEREADAGGIRRMIAGGYDASGALSALQRLSEQAPAGGGTVYASHPKMTERMARYRQAIAGELAASVATGREIRSAEYQAQIAALPLDQVTVLLDAGALDRAEAQVRAVIARADSGRAAFLQGEISRARIPQTDATRLAALAAYERAMALPDPPPAAFREAGLLHRLRGETAAAAVAFQGYLAHAPEAADAPLVHRYLDARASASQTSGDPK